MAKVTPDKYTNVAYGVVTMTGGDVLTFDQIRFAVGIFQGVAIVLHRVLYYPTEISLRTNVTATTSLTVGITTSNRLLALTEISDHAIVDRVQNVGVGVAVEPRRLPFISDMSHLPAGGRILAPNPLFLAMDTAGFAAQVGACRAQLEFTFVELSDKDYIELIQSQLPANI